MTGRSLWNCVVKPDYELQGTNWEKGRLVNGFLAIEKTNGADFSMPSSKRLKYAKI